MYTDAEKDGAQWAATGDNRITKVGKWIRKFRIDELPQVINVLRGEMSIVGPRPERPEFVSMLEEKIPFYGLRHSVRPGHYRMGPDQISIWRQRGRDENKTRYDLFYIKHISIHWT